MRQMSRKNHIESLLNRLDEQTEKDYQYVRYYSNN
jgi:hypothetical protein